VAVDRGDNVYVLERNRDGVQKFDAEGQFLSEWKSNTEQDLEYSPSPGVAWGLGQGTLLKRWD